ncbi:hypothetical protein Cs7R123_45980 [Catellatospora sp. TT07R-123]|uniref:hypothetical protein n=1 Tax=Catellatospora sp. TT07R-123 TaxID=2733863 RepID=UPI001B1D490A|nr:hypothetical protein [Catellatospora sp. TT07R-123]GHJ47256.1 hypothetical protein Cs7R123_45980 [Catellatospora sp. TT07R-123]
MSAPTPAASQSPVPFVATGARRFAATLGSPAPAVDYSRIRLDPTTGAAIAAAYLAAPVRQHGARAAYAAFCAETVRQFHYLVGRPAYGGLGVAVRIVDEDPYPDMAAMIADLRERRLKVFASAACGNPHPYLSDAENDMFRAVHDAFGHAASGRGFDADGEEAAWRKHCTMYSELARRAMTTETRGQSCVLFVHYRGMRFPEQKAALLPVAFSDLRSVRLAVR